MLSATHICLSSSQRLLTLKHYVWSFILLYLKNYRTSQQTCLIWDRTLQQNTVKKDKQASTFCVLYHNEIYEAIEETICTQPHNVAHLGGVWNTDKPLPAVFWHLQVLVTKKTPNMNPTICPFRRKALFSFNKLASDKWLSKLWGMQSLGGGHMISISFAPSILRFADAWCLEKMTNIFPKWWFIDDLLWKKVNLNKQNDITAWFKFSAFLGQINQ